MTAPYRHAMDLRERAMARKAAGETNSQIAAALRIAPSCVCQWTGRERETGAAAPAADRRLQAADAAGGLKAERAAERTASGAVHAEVGIDR